MHVDRIVERAGRLPVDALVSGALDLDGLNAGSEALAGGAVVRQLVRFPGDG